MIEEIEPIKPGPKPKREDGGPDERRRVTQEKKPGYPPLKPHIHRPGEKR